LTEKKAKQASPDDQKIISLLLESKGIFVVVLDREGKILRFSEGAVRLSGWREEEALGKHLWDLATNQADQVRLSRLFAVYVRRHSFPLDYEIHWTNHENRQIWLRFTVSDVISQGPEEKYLFIGHETSNQVHSERHLETKLQEQELLAKISRNFIVEEGSLGEKYTAALAELAQFLRVERALFHITDSEKNQIVETYEYAAPGYPPVGINMVNLPLEMLGMQLKKVTNARPIAYSHADDYLKHFSHLADFWELLASKAHMSQPLYQGDTMLGFISLHSCEAPREWSNENKLLLELVADSFQAVFLWAREQQRLQELQELWKFALEGSGEGVWEWDFETGATTYDRRWKEILGYAPDEIFSMHENFVTLLHPEDRAFAMNDEIEQMLAQGRFTCRFRMRHKDGSYRYILSRGMVASWRGEGLPKKIVGTHMDITEQMQREQESVEASRYREEFEKVASLGTMVAGVAHEINQPLQAMKMTVDGALYWQKKGKDLPKEKLLADYQLLSTQITRVDRIIQRLRKFIVQGRSAVMQETSVTAAIEGALEVVGNQLRSHGILIESKFAADIPLIWGDPERLEEAIVNLLVNAMQAMDKPGVAKRMVFVRAGLLPEAGTGIYIEVEDTGPGVPEEMLERLFEPFVSSKIATNARSMGLGLSIVHSTVLAMNGSVTVRNKSGEPGACFLMTFPLSQKKGLRKTAKK
jgi:PAS domain S-box-containing protein